MSHLSGEIEEIDHEIRYLQLVWESINPYWKDKVKAKFEGQYWTEYIAELENLRRLIVEMDQIFDSDDSEEE